MSQFKFDLPIDDALPTLLAAMRDHGHGVLQAPPGAGKTTRVPIALHAARLFKGKILMLEPRRLAARAAAARLAQAKQLGIACEEIRKFLRTHKSRWLLRVF